MNLYLRSLRIILWLIFTFIAMSFFFAPDNFVSLQVYGLFAVGAGAMGLEFADD